MPVWPNFKQKMYLNKISHWSLWILTGRKFIQLTSSFTHKFVTNILKLDCFREKEEVLLWNGIAYKRLLINLLKMDFEVKSVCHSHVQTILHKYSWQHCAPWLRQKLTFKCFYTPVHGVYSILLLLAIAIWSKIEKIMAGF